MNVISLFDGMGCSYLALQKAGIEIKNYFAYEIDKFAIEQTSKEVPLIKHMGSVTDFRKEDLGGLSIDLIIGGSPCQGFSFAGKQLAFDDPRSALFFEYVRILKEVREINPNVKFLLENVRMKSEHEFIISQYLGVYPVAINSNLVSAQNRHRLYWSNIRTKTINLFGELVTDIPQPKNLGILLGDILENEVDEKYYLSEKAVSFFKSNSEKMQEAGNGFKFELSDIDKKSKTITTKECSRMENNFIRTKNYVQWDASGKGFKSQQDLAFYESGKHGALANARAETKTGVVITHNMQPRQGKGQGGKGHLQKNDQKSYCVDTTQSNAVEYDERIRRLTVRECSRLQTVPDSYTWHVSDSQAYKMLGNGFTVDAIAHILKHLNTNTTL